MNLSLFGCTESTWIPELPLDACVAAEGPMACSCPTSTSTETWTVSESWGGTCSLAGPGGSACTATAVTGGYTMDCEYAYGAPACASLKFTRPSGHEDLVGFVVSDPVCTSSPVSPNTGGTVTMKMQIPNHDQRPNRVVWEAWETTAKTGGCSIAIETAELPQNQLSWRP